MLIAVFLKMFTKTPLVHYAIAAFQGWPGTAAANTKCKWYKRQALNAWLSSTELELDRTDVQKMTTQLREGVIKKSLK